MSRGIAADRILGKLDEHLNKNDYAAAERHLDYWLGEAQTAGDRRTELLVRNELLGLYRKCGRRQQALDTVTAVLALIETDRLWEQVGAATALLNCATVYKAFDRAAQAVPLFEKARTVYERELPPDDPRLGGLYNNMALALVDLARFDEAHCLYQAAVRVMEQAPDGALEVAITYLNMATAAETEQGLTRAEAEINAHLDAAKALLEQHPKRDGYYAFVCEKCASVFGYYGFFAYENELKERATNIYEGNRTF